MAPEKLVVTDIRTPGAIQFLNALSWYVSPLLLAGMLTERKPPRVLGWI